MMSGVLPPIKKGGALFRPSQIVPSVKNPGAHGCKTVSMERR